MVQEQEQEQVQGNRQKPTTATLNNVSGTTHGLPNRSVVVAGGKLAPKPQGFNGATKKQRHSLAHTVEQNATEQEETLRGPLVKAELTRLDVKQLPNEKPDFDATSTSKDMVIADWLRHWIETGLKTAQLNINQMLPRKADLAKVLGVSVGTVQNAIRYIEDDGFVESKQRIGTVISDRSDAESGERLRKQTSKRDQAVLAVRKFIIARGLEPGNPMPSAREVAKVIGSAPNTTRLALEALSSSGILKSQGVRGNKANWFVEELPDISDDNSVGAIESETLIDQLERDLKTLIAQQFQVGDKLNSHLELAEQFRVSIKTVHDALRRLAQQGIIQSKRGRYGTYISRLPETTFATPKEEAFFIPAEQHAFYNYQRVGQLLPAYIAEHFKPGDKLPPMGELAERFKVSSNTIRKALQALGKEGFLSFSRGRFGGTFVEKLPTLTPEQQKALARQLT